MLIYGFLRPFDFLLHIDAYVNRNTYIFYSLDHLLPFSVTIQHCDKNTIQHGTTMCVCVDVGPFFCIICSVREERKDRE